MLVLLTTGNILQNCSTSVAGVDEQQCDWPLPEWAELWHTAEANIWEYIGCECKH